MRLIDPGVIARVIGAASETRPSMNADLRPRDAGSVNGSGGAGQSWFGPGIPMRPQAQKVQGRALDFPSSYNLQQRPRTGEAIDFGTLRMLADNFDLLRLVIETRKDQIAKLEWNIQPRGGVKKADKMDEETKARCKRIEKFLRYPNRENDWGTWLRILLEDVLVLDAPSVYVRRDGIGEVYSLDIIDGSTIKRVIDEYGRTPIAPATAYQQILKGMPAVDYNTDELYYMPRNPRPHKIYGQSPVEQVITTVNIAIRRQASQLQYYTEGNIPEALIGTPESWTPQQVSEFQAYWDALLEGNTAARRHAKFVPGQLGVQFTRSDNNLMDQYDEWLARIICYCFSLPPLPFVKQMNRATAQTHYQMALEEGLIPMLNWVKSLIDRVISRAMGADDLEFAWVDDKEVDPQARASIDNIYLRMGVKSIDEVREELGLDPLGMDHAIIGAGPMGAIFIKDLLNPEVRAANVESLKAIGQPQPMIDPNTGMPIDPSMMGGMPPDNRQPGPDVDRRVYEELLAVEAMMSKAEDVPVEVEELLADRGYKVVEDDGVDAG
jgi:hypothetical protein